MPTDPKTWTDEQVNEIHEAMAEAVYRPGMDENQVTRSVIGLLATITKNPTFARQPRKNLRTRQMLHDLYIRDGRACQLCATTENLVVDHVIPLARGGVHHIENLQILCSLCNARKGAR